MLLFAALEARAKGSSVIHDGHLVLGALRASGHWRDRIDVEHLRKCIPSDSGADRLSVDPIAQGVLEACAPETTADVIVQRILDDSRSFTKRALR